MANSVQQTTDGGYVIAGSTRGFASDLTKKYNFLIKTTSTGVTTAACNPTDVVVTASALTSTTIAHTETVTANAGWDIPITTTTVSAAAPTTTTLCSVVLPVELISFTAQCSDNNTTLYWSTATEINNNYFSVERSSDGINFEAIGKVNGAGNSSTARNYEFIYGVLPSPVGERSGVRYYRLKQVDYNGKYEYSPLTSVSFPCREDGIEILPNPSTGVFSVGGLLSGSEISLFNIVGKKIICQTSDTKFITISIADRPKGVYFLKAVVGDKVYTKKIILD